MNASSDFDVFDDVLPDPWAYRQAVLSRAFQDVAIGPAVFHGIGFGADLTVPDWLRQRYPTLTPTTSFFRQSPAEQEEPNFIHTDCDMGEWTAILYLTPDPLAGDGTTFWRHRATGRIASEARTLDEHVLEAVQWRRTEDWVPLETVPARFNRLVTFPAAWFHSRALHENYGAGDDARLIQVVFGLGDYARRREVEVCR